MPVFIQERRRRWEPRLSPLVFRSVLVSLFVAAIVIPLGIMALPYLDLLNDMAVQPKGKAQGTYGRTFGEELVVDRKPVAGTTPRSYTSYPFDEDGDEAAEAAGKTLVNPLTPTLEVLERGQRLFNRYCRTCHGVGGDGDGPIVGPDRFPAPTSLHTSTVRQLPDGRIFHRITRGQDPMPGYADKLAPSERWATVHFVRVLQRARNPKPEDIRDE